MKARGCKACANRKRRGLDGPCPSCALKERTLARELDRAAEQDAEENIEALQALLRGE